MNGMNFLSVVFLFMVSNSDVIAAVDKTSDAYKAGDFMGKALLVITVLFLVKRYVFKR